MKLEFIPKFITLLAGAIVCIITIVNDMDTVYSLELLLATLVIFYIMGVIAKKIIQKVIEGNMFVKQQDNSGNDMNIPSQEEASEADEVNVEAVTKEAGE